MGWGYGLVWDVFCEEGGPVRCYFIFMGCLAPWPDFSLEGGV